MRLTCFDFRFVSRARARSARIISLPLLLLLGGCGGGGSGAGPVTSLPVPAPAAAIQDAPFAAQAATGSAIAHHIAPATFDFNNFRTVSLTLNLVEMAADLAGELYVVKVSDSASNTLYLAVHEVVGNLPLELSVPLAEQRLWLEVYTEVSDQGAVIKEIIL